MRLGERLWRWHDRRSTATWPHSMSPSEAHSRRCGGRSWRSCHRQSLSPSRMGRTDLHDQRRSHICPNHRAQVAAVESAEQQSPSRRNGRQQCVHGEERWREDLPSPGDLHHGQVQGPARAAGGRRAGSSPTRRERSRATYGSIGHGASTTPRNTCSSKPSRQRSGEAQCARRTSSRPSRHCSPTSSIHPASSARRSTRTTGRSWRRCGRVASAALTGDDAEVSARHAAHHGSELTFSVPVAPSPGVVSGTSKPKIGRSGSPPGATTALSSSSHAIAKKPKSFFCLQLCSRRLVRFPQCGEDQIPLGLRELLHSASRYLSNHHCFTCVRWTVRSLMLPLQFDVLTDTRAARSRPRRCTRRPRLVRLWARGSPRADTPDTIPAPRGSVRLGRYL